MPFSIDWLTRTPSLRVCGAADGCMPRHGVARSVGVGWLDWSGHPPRRMGWRSDACALVHDKGRWAQTRTPHHMRGELANARGRDGDGNLDLPIVPSHFIDTAKDIPPTPMQRTRRPERPHVRGSWTVRSSDHPRAPRTPPYRHSKRTRSVRENACDLLCPWEGG